MAGFDIKLNGLLRYHRVDNLELQLEVLLYFIWLFGLFNVCVFVCSD